MNIARFSKSIDGETRLSENFKVKEFACQDGSDTILIDLDMIPILQSIRNVGGKVTINSAYRTESHNKAVGGAKNSYHIFGRAFDITSENLDVEDICELANTLGVKGIIKYPTFVHIDSRTSQYHADNKGKLIHFKKYEETALDYLVQKERILNKKLWQEKMADSSIKWLIIKWSIDVKTLDKNKQLR